MPVLLAIHVTAHLPQISVPHADGSLKAIHLTQIKSLKARRTQFCFSKCLSLISKKGFFFRPNVSQKPKWRSGAGGWEDVQFYLGSITHATSCLVGSHVWRHLSPQTQNRKLLVFLFQRQLKRHTHTLQIWVTKLGIGWYVGLLVHIMINQILNLLLPKHPF